MERVINSDERIRRAEEIYARRKRQNGVRVPTNAVNNKKEYSLLKKMMLQIAICLLLYFIFYLIKNSNYIFSENVIETSKNFLEYDIPFEKYYHEAVNFYDNNLKAYFVLDKETNEINEGIANNLQDAKIENNSVNEVELGIGGENESKLSENNMIKDELNDENVKENNAELSQMEIDANEIKNNYNLILPLNGIVSSRFGPRTPTDIVSANHAGIDIAANEGTVFNAAMDGIVTFVSSEGRLWKAFICGK